MATKKQKKKLPSTPPMVCVDPLPRLHIETPEYGQVELWQADDGGIYASFDCGSNVQLTKTPADARCLAGWLLDMVNSDEPEH